MTNTTTNCAISNIPYVSTLKIRETVSASPPTASGLQSTGAVRVRSVSISADNGWKITAYGGKDTLAREKVDSNKFGFALRLGGGPLCSTDGTSETGATLISAPQTGCYMCGAGDTTGNSLAVYYDAIVTPLSHAVVDANIADVVFVVEWDT